MHNYKGSTPFHEAKENLSMHLSMIQTYSDLSKQNMSTKLL